MSRGGQTKKPNETERRCIARFEALPKASLVRFVIDPDGLVTPDLAGKLPGRGIWVSADRTALEKAIGKNLFARAARKSARLPEDLLVLVEGQMVKRLISLLSLSRKGGYGICGFDKTKETLVGGSAVVLLQASDGSEGQKSKLRAPMGDNTYISCLSAQELGLAFGRENVIHAALAAGGLTELVKTEAARLTGIRGPHAL